MTKSYIQLTLNDGSTIKYVNKNNQDPNKGQQRQPDGSLGHDGPGSCLPAGASLPAVHGN